jgi:general stress protein YciG
MDREEVRELGRRGGEASHGGRHSRDDYRSDGSYRNEESYRNDGRSQQRGESTHRGFETMSRSQVRRIASMGGKAAARTRRVSERRRSRSSR